MYRIMIVDDEPDIVDSLYMLFKELDRIELDIYRAYSAKEALDWLNRTKIDIVLTDIRMPGMTGLQMMEVILENWPQCRVIFLTGYNDFDYVYSAIKHNGVRYLLKTEGHEAIIEAVENAVNEIEKSMEIDELLANARQKINLAMPLLQKEYMMDLLFHDVPDKSDIEKQFDEMGITLSASMPVLLMLGKVDNPQQSVSLLERFKLANSINMLVDKYLIHAVKSISFEYERFSMLWIIQPQKVDGNSGGNCRLETFWERILLLIRNTLETIQEVCKESLNTSISFVIDNECTEWEAVPDRFDHLKKLLNYRIGTGTEMQLIVNDISLYAENDSTLTNSGVQKAKMLMKKIRTMEIYLESGQKEHFVMVLTELTSYLKEMKSKNSNFALEMYYSISLMFLSYINRWNLAEKIASSINLETLTCADKHMTWQEAVEYFMKLTDIIFEIQRNEEDKRALAAINKVQQYINEHLSEDLSLVRLGELVHFNPSYLSRLFKQVAGVNLSSYINDIRFKKAKELLGESDMKIHEIASNLGYISAPYFTRFFKKYADISPQEYRDSFLNR